MHSKFQFLFKNKFSCFSNTFIQYLPIVKFYRNSFTLKQKIRKLLIFGIRKKKYIKHGFFPLLKNPK